MNSRTNENIAAANRVAWGKFFERIDAETVNGVPDKDFYVYDLNGKRLIMKREEREYFEYMNPRAKRLDNITPIIGGDGRVKAVPDEQVESYMASNKGSKAFYDEYRRELDPFAYDLEQKRVKNEAREIKKYGLLNEIALENFKGLTRMTKQDETKWAQDVGYEAAEDWGAVGKYIGGLGTGAQGSIAGILGAVERLWSDDADVTLSDYAKAYNAGYHQQVADTHGFIGQVGLTAIESLPLQFATGGVSKGLAAAGLAGKAGQFTALGLTFGLSSGGNKFNDLRGSELPLYRQVLSGIATGLAETGTEMISWGHVERWAKAMGKSKAILSMKPFVREFVSRVLPNMLTEGGEEVLNSIAGAMFDYMIEGKTVNEREFLDEIVLGFTAGAVGAGITSPIVGAVYGSGKNPLTEALESGVRRQETGDRETDVGGVSEPGGTSQTSPMPPLVAQQEVPPFPQGNGDLSQSAPVNSDNVGPSSSQSGTLFPVDADDVRSRQLKQCVEKIKATLNSATYAGNIDVAIAELDEFLNWHTGRDGQPIQINEDYYNDVKALRDNLVSAKATKTDAANALTDKIGNEIKAFYKDMADLLDIDVNDLLGSNKKTGEPLLKMKIKNFLNLLTTVENFVPANEKVAKLVKQYKSIVEAFDSIKNGEIPVIMIGNREGLHDVDQLFGFANAMIEYYTGEVSDHINRLFEDNKRLRGELERFLKNGGNGTEQIKKYFEGVKQVIEANTEEIRKLVSNTFGASEELGVRSEELGNGAINEELGIRNEELNGNEELGIRNEELSQSAPVVEEVLETDTENEELIKAGFKRNFEDYTDEEKYHHKKQTYENISRLLKGVELDIEHKTKNKTKDNEMTLNNVGKFLGVERKANEGLKAYHKRLKSVLENRIQENEAFRDNEELGIRSEELSQSAISEKPDDIANIRGLVNEIEDGAGFDNKAVRDAKMEALEAELNKYYEKVEAEVKRISELPADEREAAIAKLSPVLAELEEIEGKYKRYSLIGVSGRVNTERLVIVASDKSQESGKRKFTYAEKRAAGIASNFGHKLVIFNGDRVGDIEAFIQDDEIWINADNNDLADVVIRHELVHAIKSGDITSYNKLSALIEKTVAWSNFKKMNIVSYRRRYRNETDRVRRKALMAGKSAVEAKAEVEAYIDEELKAQFIRERMTSKIFWQKLSGNRNLFIKISAAVGEFFRELRVYFGNKEGLAEYKTFRKIERQILESRLEVARAMGLKYGEMAGARLSVEGEKAVGRFGKLLETLNDSRVIGLAETRDVKAALSAYINPLQEQIKVLAKEIDSLENGLNEVNWTEKIKEIAHKESEISKIITRAKDKIRNEYRELSKERQGEISQSIQEANDRLKSEYVIVTDRLKTYSRRLDRVKAKWDSEPKIDLAIKPKDVRTGKTFEYDNSISPRKNAVKYAMSNFRFIDIDINKGNNIPKNNRAVYTVADTNMKFIISKRGIDETAGNYGDEQIKSIYYLPSICEDSVYLGSETNTEKNNKRDVERYEYYFNKVKVSNGTESKQYLVKLVFEVYKGEDIRFYSHTLSDFVEIEKIAGSSDSIFSNDGLSTHYQFESSEPLWTPPINDGPAHSLTLVQDYRLRKLCQELFFGKRMEGTIKSIMKQVYKLHGEGKYDYAKDIAKLIDRNYKDILSNIDELQNMSHEITEQIKQYKAAHQAEHSEMFETLHENIQRFNSIFRETQKNIFWVTIRLRELNQKNNYDDEYNAIMRFRVQFEDYDKRLNDIINPFQRLGESDKKDDKELYKALLEKTAEMLTERQAKKAKPAPVVELTLERIEDIRSKMRQLANSLHWIKSKMGGLIDLQARIEEGKHTQGDIENALKDIRWGYDKNKALDEQIQGDMDHLKQRQAGDERILSKICEDLGIEYSPTEDISQLQERIEEILKIQEKPLLQAKQEADTAKQKAIEAEKAQVRAMSDAELLEAVHKYEQEYNKLVYNLRILNEIEDSIDYKKDKIEYGVKGENVLKRLLGDLYLPSVQEAFERNITEPQVNRYIEKYINKIAESKLADYEIKRELGYLKESLDRVLQHQQEVIRDSKNETEKGRLYKEKKDFEFRLKNLNLKLSKMLNKELMIDFENHKAKYRDEMNYRKMYKILGEYINMPFEEITNEQNSNAIKELLEPYEEIANRLNRIFHSKDVISGIFKQSDIDFIKSILGKEYNPNESIFNNLVNALLDYSHIKNSLKNIIDIQRGPGLRTQNEYEKRKEIVRNGLNDIRATGEVQASRGNVTEERLAHTGNNKHNYQAEMDNISKLMDEYVTKHKELDDFDKLVEFSSEYQEQLKEQKKLKDKIRGQLQQLAKQAGIDDMGGSIISMYDWIGGKLGLTINDYFDNDARLSLSDYSGPGRFEKLRAELEARGHTLEPDAFDKVSRELDRVKRMLTYSDDKFAREIQDYLTEERLASIEAMIETSTPKGADDTVLSMSEAWAEAVAELKAGKINESFTIKELGENGYKLTIQVIKILVEMNAVDDKIKILHDGMRAFPENSQMKVDFDNAMEDYYRLWRTYNHVLSGSARVLHTAKAQKEYFGNREGVDVNANIQKRLNEEVQILIQECNEKNMPVEDTLHMIEGSRAERTRKQFFDNPERTANDESKLRKPTIWELIRMSRYASLLSGVTTHIRNMFNTAGNVAVMEPLVNMFMDIAKYQTTVGWRGIGEGYVAGVKAGKTIMMGGLPTNEALGIKMKVPNFQQNMLALKAWQRRIMDLIQFSSKMLTAEDAVNYGAAIANTAHQYALELSCDIFKNRGGSRYLLEYSTQLGLDGKDYDDLMGMTREDLYEHLIANPTEEMIELIAEMGLERTYNQKVPEYFLGWLANAINEGREKMIKSESNVTQGFEYLTEWVMPFTRVVANVTNNQISYTPFGFLFYLHDVAKMKQEQRIKAGKSNPEINDLIYESERGQTEAKRNNAKKKLRDMLYKDMLRGLIRDRKLREQLTKAIAGSIFYGLVAWFLKDHVSGSGAGLTTEQRNQMRDTGWQANSIRVGDKWLSYSNMPGLSLGLAVIGNFNDAWRYKKFAEDGQELYNRLGYATLGIGHVFFDQSFLQGMADLTEMVGNADVRRAERFFAQGLLSPLPTNYNIVKYIHDIFDPSMKRPVSLAQAMLHETRAVTNPLGWTENTPNLVNVFGEVREKKMPFRTLGGTIGLFSAMGYGMESIADPELLEIAKGVLGAGAYLPASNGRVRITVNGEAVDLRNKQSEEFLISRGKHFAMLLKQPINKKFIMYQIERIERGENVGDAMYGLKKRLEELHRAANEHGKNYMTIKLGGSSWRSLLSGF